MRGDRGGGRYVPPAVCGDGGRRTGMGTGAGVVAGVGRPGPGEGTMTDVLGGPGGMRAAAGGGAMMPGDRGRLDVRR